MPQFVLNLASRHLRIGFGLVLDFGVPSGQVRTVNVLGIHNVSLDVAALTDFADESGIATLRECFSKLMQLVDIVLT